MEIRADHAESEALADPQLYMRSMLRLHQVNAAPAVMPGQQTHPHVYDRLLAGGVQPDFPRPKAPSRARPLLAAIGTAFATLIAAFLLLVILNLAQRPAATTPGEADSSEARR
jgi:hypothetical protein